jgi:hypothetical protein
MHEIEGFETIISSLTLAKALYDIGRHDVLGQFSDVLCWDSYYENMMGTISSVFTGFECDYAEYDETEFMEFKDDVISAYFVHAWEYGKLHKLHYSQNPHIAHAQEEVRRWLNSSCCIDWKLLVYLRSKKSARKSKLFVRMYHGGCGGCGIHEIVAYGLIRLYTWFKEKCAEFETMKAAPVKPKEKVSDIRAKTEHREVMAA